MDDLLESLRFLTTLRIPEFVPELSVAIAWRVIGILIGILAVIVFLIWAVGLSRDSDRDEHEKSAAMIIGTIVIFAAVVASVPKSAPAGLMVLLFGCVAPVFLVDGLFFGISLVRLIRLNRFLLLLLAIVVFVALVVSLHITQHMGLVIGYFALIAIAFAVELYLRARQFGMYLVVPIAMTAVFVTAMTAVKKADLQQMYVALTTEYPTVDRVVGAPLGAEAQEDLDHERRLLKYIDRRERRRKENMTTYLYRPAYVFGSVLAAFGFPVGALAGGLLQYRRD